MIILRLTFRLRHVSILNGLVDVIFSFFYFLYFLYSGFSFDVSLVTPASLALTSMLFLAPSYHLIASRYPHPYPVFISALFMSSNRI